MFNISRKNVNEFPFPGIETLKPDSLRKNKIHYD